MGKNLEFKTLAKGYYSNNIEAVEKVIYDAVDYVNLKSKINIEMPSSINIDFSKEMVIAVFQGQRDTGGYEILIEKVEEKDNSLRVYVNEISPSDDSIITQAFSSPYHIIQLPISNKQIEYIFTPLKQIS